MQLTVEPVARLIEQFARLPGIGPKTAQRLTFYLLRAPEQVSNELAEAIGQMKLSVKFCSVCQNITDAAPCAVCRAEKRDRSVICVVEEPLDILALERTGEYKGLYHVLHGAISPVDGIGPEKLRIKELETRVARDLGEGGEVILATNHDMPGNATAMFIARHLIPTGVKVTRLASGLPAGGDLEYADEVTLGRAISGRRAM
jgi:recombination protein RecR